MKKLALASVAFAGISAFGAGDAYASGAVFYFSASSFNSAPSGPVDDTATWVPGPGGAATVGSVPTVGAGGTGYYSATTSVTSVPHGVKVTGGLRTLLFAGSTSTVNYGTQNGTPHTVNYGFPNNTAVLYGSTTGTMGLAFSRPVKGVGFYVAPWLNGKDTGSTFNALVSMFGATTGSGTHVSLGSADPTGNASTGCTTSRCTYVGATVGSPNVLGITSVTVFLSTGSFSDGGSPLPPAISSLSLEEPTESAATPEPASLSILGIGLLGLGALRRRRRSADPGDPWRWSPFGRWRVSGIPLGGPPT